MSKRKLLQLVQQKHVTGWDDPRMPTLAGMRRRGYTPEAIRTFCERIGVAKCNSTVDIAMLEHCLREDLNKRAPRVMAVLRPLKVVLENYPEGQVEELEAVNNPEDAEHGHAQGALFAAIFTSSRTIFAKSRPKDFSVCRRATKCGCATPTSSSARRRSRIPTTGEITELRCTYDPETKSGSSQAQRKVKATIHWVSAAARARSAEVRLYDHLFTKEDPDDVPEGADWLANLNPKSLEVIKEARVEPFLANAKTGELYQFERLGYFCVDPIDTAAGRLVFNRAVTLRDTWAKIEKSAKAGKRA